MDDVVPPPLNPPPPPAAPPPVLVPPKPTPPRRRVGWIILSLILLGLLGISMLFNIAHFIQKVVHVNGGRLHESGPRLEETVVEDNDATAKFVVITVDGIITGQKMDGGYSMVEIIKAQLKRADDDNKVKAVILKVDSPGGEVLASDEISKAISDFQDGTNGKPVIVSMGSLAASGGYYISAPCRWIVANELTITASIGVIMETFNYRGLMDKVGLKPVVFKSGKHKDMLSGAREPEEVPQDEKDMVQALITQTYEKFKGVVQEGRDAAFALNKTNGNQLSESWTNYADGRVLSGKDAYDLGFVDQLGNFDDAVDTAMKITHLKEKPNLVEYAERKDLADLFRLFGESNARGVKVDLGVSMPKLQAGHLYYLTPTYIY